MATPGLIARTRYPATGPTWEATHHNGDNDPAQLGVALWRAAHHFGSVSKLLHFLFDEHPAGWSRLVDADFSLTPGWEHYRGRDNGPQRPRCFCHGERRDEPLDLLGPDDDSGADWCYVFDARSRSMAVLRAGSGWRLRWEQVTRVWLDGPEPGWETLADWQPTPTPPPGVALPSLPGWPASVPVTRHAALAEGALVDATTGELAAVTRAWAGDETPVAMSAAVCKLLSRAVAPDRARPGWPLVWGTMLGAVVAGRDAGYGAKAFATDLPRLAPHRQRFVLVSQEEGGAEAYTIVLASEWQRSAAWRRAA